MKKFKNVELIAEINGTRVLTIDSNEKSSECTEAEAIQYFLYILSLKDWKEDEDDEEIARKATAILEAGDYRFIPYINYSGDNFAECYINL